MICPKCKTYNKDSAHYCMACNSSLTGNINFENVSDSNIQNNQDIEILDDILNEHEQKINLEHNNYPISNNFENNVLSTNTNNLINQGNRKYNSDKINNKKRINIKILCIIIGIVIVGIISCFILNNVNNYTSKPNANADKNVVEYDNVILNDNLVFEINSEVSLLSLVSDNNKVEITSKDEIIDTSSLGRKEIIIKYKNIEEKEYKFNIEIVDTTVPIIEYKKELTTTSGAKIDLLSNVVVIDNSKEEIKATVEGEYNFDKVGTYNLKYVAIDSSNNRVEKGFTLIVNEKPVSPTKPIKPTTPTTPTKPQTSITPQTPTKPQTSTTPQTPTKPTTPQTSTTPQTPTNNSTNANNVELRLTSKLDSSNAKKIIIDFEGTYDKVECVYGTSEFYGFSGQINGNTCIFVGETYNTKYYYKIVATRVENGVEKIYTGKGSGKTGYGIPGSAFFE